MVDGNGSPTDFTVADGGAGSPYSANANVWDNLDNGAITTTQTPTTTAASSSPPGWLQGLIADVPTLASAAQPVAAIINGQPSKSVVAPAAPTTAQGTTPISKTSSFLPLLVIAGLAFFLFGGKKARA